MKIENKTKNPHVLPNGQTVGVGETITITEGDEAAVAGHPITKALVADKTFVVTDAPAKKPAKKADAGKDENLGPGGKPVDPLS